MGAAGADAAARHSPRRARGADGRYLALESRTARSGIGSGSATGSGHSSARCASAPGPVPAPGGDHRLARPRRRHGRPTGSRSRSCIARSASSAPSPVVELNRAAAVGFADGPQAGLELLGPLLAEPALERYQPLYAAHAELLRRAGEAGAARAYERAIALSANAVERAELQRRLATLDAD